MKWVRLLMWIAKKVRGLSEFANAPSLLPKGTRQSFADLGMELSGAPFDGFLASAMASRGAANVLPRA